MTDPMDTPPVDHGSDRFNYVEVTAPGGTRPIGQWWDDLIAEPCGHCNANVFATYVNGPMSLPPSWRIEIAHDETCPVSDAL